MTVSSPNVYSFGHHRALKTSEGSSWRGSALLAFILITQPFLLLSSTVCLCCSHSQQATLSTSPAVHAVSPSLLTAIQHRVLAPRDHARSSQSHLGRLGLSQSEPRLGECHGTYSFPLCPVTSLGALGSHVLTIFGEPLKYSLKSRSSI